MTKLKSGIASINQAFPRIFVRLAFGIIILLVFGMIKPSFLSASNLKMVFLVQTPTFLLLSCAMTIAILLGGIDLSIGSSMGLSTCACAMLLKSTENPVLSIVLALLVGMAVGAFNGFLISKIKIPIFIATYGMDWVIKGFLYIMMNGLSIYGFVSSFRIIGTSYVGVFPVTFLIALVIMVLLIFAFHKTTFGKRFYATARNREATAIAGVSNMKMIISSYMVIGALAASAGIMYLSQLDAVDASIGENWTLKLVAITLLGGTQNNGGVGSVVNTFVGTLIYLFIMNALTIIGIPSTWQDAIIGCLVILSVSIETIGTKIQASNAKKALLKQA